MHFLCPSADLADASSRGFEVEGLAVLAVRREGRVYLYRNLCPHRGVRLEWQPDQFLDSSASLIQCARHGALFLMESGECVAGPCAGEQLQALACQEDARGIWLQAPSNTGKRRSM
jgi:nitrite reductase/ring-hydroxylating ferredoxin subunit